MHSKQNGYWSPRESLRLRYDSGGHEGWRTKTGFTKKSHSCSNLRNSVSVPQVKYTLSRILGLIVSRGVCSQRKFERMQSLTGPGSFVVYCAALTCCRCRKPLVPTKIRRNVKLRVIVRWPRN